MINLVSQQENELLQTKGMKLKVNNSIFKIKKKKSSKIKTCSLIRIKN